MRKQEQLILDRFHRENEKRTFRINPRIQQRILTTFDQTRVVISAGEL